MKSAPTVFESVAIEVATLRKAPKFGFVEVDVPLAGYKFGFLVDAKFALAADLGDVIRFTFGTFGYWTENGNRRLIPRSAKVLASMQSGRHAPGDGTRWDIVFPLRSKVSLFDSPDRIEAIKTESDVFAYAAECPAAVIMTDDKILEAYCAQGKKATILGKFATEAGQQVAVVNPVWVEWSERYQAERKVF